MQLSLAGWSLQSLFRASCDPLSLVDYPRFARDQFGIGAVELNNLYFASRESAYLREIVRSAESAGVRLLNIAVDEKGDLASEDESLRAEGIACYARWIPVAREIGCTAIRANSGGKNIYDVNRAVQFCTESFRRLADEGLRHGITILIENHGGISYQSYNVVEIVRGVIKTHGPDAIGTLPDFGNWPETTSRYASLREILPYAKLVHAKVLDIDADLNHSAFDLARCIDITRESGYRGFLGIEYEGAAEPIEGVRRAVRKLTPFIRAAG